MTNRKEAIDADVATPAEIESLLNALKQAAGQPQTDATIEAQAAEIEKLRDALHYAQQVFRIYVENERPNRYTMTFKILADKCRKALEQST